MKRYTIGLITLLLIVGCSKEPINYETTLIQFMDTESMDTPRIRSIY